MDEENANFENHYSPYAGRWVALLRGRVIAQGGTPQQALRASQSSRHKEKPEIVFMPVPFLLPPVIDKIKDALPADQEIYLVGGAVRDLLTSRLASDFDFALPSNGISIARTVAKALNADFMPLDDERDTGRVVLIHEDGKRTFLDFATYRGADPLTSSHRPNDFSGGQSLDEDLRARDFTINAMAYNLRDHTIIDPLEGANDIRAKVIRACSPTSLSDDPVRILRAVRQAAAFGFKIEMNTRKWMKQSVSQIERISAERLRDEVFKMLNGPQADDSIRALEMLGVLPHLMPELPALKGVQQSPPHIHDVWTHTLAVLHHLDQIISDLQIGYDAEKTNDRFADLLDLHLGRYRRQIIQHFADPLNVDRPHRSLLFFAALYHDVCKPETKTIEETGRIRFFDHDIKGAEAAVQRARAFNLSNDEIERLHVIVKQHMRIHSFASRMDSENQTPTRKAIYRFFRDSGKASVDLILLSLADLRATYANQLTIEAWASYLELAHLLLENYWERPEEIVAPPRLLDGHELMNELKLTPGAIIGQLLEAIRENQAAGNIKSREQAISFAREEMAKGTNGE